MLFFPASADQPIIELRDSRNHVLELQTA